MPPPASSSSPALSAAYAPPSRLAWWQAIKRLPGATARVFAAVWRPTLLALAAGLAVSLVVREFEHPWQKDHLIVDPGTALHVLASYASWWGKLDHGLAVLLLGWLALAIVGRRPPGQVAVITLLWGQLVAGILVNLGKSGLGRSRPDGDLPDRFIGPTLDYAFQSFPSGHTTGAFALAVTLAVLRPRWTLPALVFAGLVGWSRLALGVHHPSDVVMGAVLGAVVGLICGKAGRRVTPPAPAARLPIPPR